MSECLNNPELIAIIGQLRRKRSFQNGERFTFEQLIEKYGACKGQCHTCAFREDSPETKAFYESYPSRMSTILENASEAAKGNAPFEPFFCHRKMSSDDGGQNFQPDYDEGGLPVGHMLCAGWVKLVRSQQTLISKEKQDEQITTTATTER
jgi:hypothetical protein